MQKQLGRIGAVRHRYAEPQAHGSAEMKLDAPSDSCVAHESQVCMLSPASFPALGESATPVNNNVINLLSSAPVLPDNQAAVRNTAESIASDEPTPTLEASRGYDMRDMQHMSDIVAMPFVAWEAWRAYRTHLRHRQSTVQMLARSCVLRPGDVELRYSTPLQKIGVCMGAPDTQSSHDMEFSLYLEPSTDGMRAQGTQALHWVRHEWTTRFMPIVQRSVAAGRRCWILLIAQVYKANAQQQQEAESDAIIRLLKTQRLQPW